MLKDIHRALVALVIGFDQDRGLPEVVYLGTLELLALSMGSGCSTMFANGIEATDKEWYWDHTDKCKAFLDRWFVGWREDTRLLTMVKSGEATWEGYS